MYLSEEKFDDFIVDEASPEIEFAVANCDRKMVVGCLALKAWL